MIHPLACFNMLACAQYTKEIASFPVLSFNVLLYTFIRVKTMTHTSTVDLLDRPTPLSQDDWSLLINLFTLSNLRLEGLWSDRSFRLTYTTISAWLIFVYKPLHSHKPEVGGLVVQSVCPIDLPYNHQRLTLG